jgi:predicted oxidoreductase
MGAAAPAPQAPVDASGKGKQRAVEPSSDADAGAAAASSASSPRAESAVDGDKATASADEPLTRPWLDALLLHSPLGSLEDTLEVWDEMQRLRDEGWVRNVGFSSEYRVRYT